MIIYLNTPNAEIVYVTLSVVVCILLSFNSMHPKYLPSINTTLKYNTH